MKKTLEIDLSDLCLILEGFTKKLDKMSKEDLVDLAARVKPAAKHCKEIDDFVKNQVKVYWLRHEEGTVKGSLFKAILKLVPTKRLNQQRLKEEKPDIHAAYCEAVEDERVTFEAR